MKVVFIVTCLPVGGAEMALYRLLSQLRSRIDAHVISLREVDEVGELIRKLGIPVEGMKMIPSRPNPLAVLKLARRLKELKPDLVQTWMYHADLLGGIATKMANPRFPVIWSVRHNNLSPGITKRATILVAKLCAWLSRLIPRKVIFNSGSSRALHSGFGYAAHKCAVIANGLDLQVFAPQPAARTAVREELGLAPDTPLVGMFARFDLIKNHEGFVKMAGQLRTKMPECHFILSGLDVDSGNPRFAQWIDEAKLAGSIHLLGPRRDMPRLMSAIDVLAMPSWGEAFPNVVAEAMACGVPCVVHAVGDAPHIAGDIGAVVQPGDEAAFVDGLERCLRLPAGARQEVSKRARARVEAYFDLGTMTDRYMEFYAREVPAGTAVSEAA